MTYCKNYCEEKEVSTSNLNEAQRTLYYIAENMKMDKSISEEGYKHFQTAIKALEQASILDEIRADIEEQVLESLSDGGDDWFAAEKVNECLEIIDKYRAGK